MPVQDVERFLAAIDHDASLQDKVQVAASGALDRMDAIAAVARAEGYDFGDDDLRSALASSADTRSSDYADLWEIAGGMARSAVFGRPQRVTQRLNLLRER